MSSGGLSAEERNRFPEMLQRGSRSDMVDFMGRDDFTMENLPFNGDYGAACNAGDGLAAMIISKFKIRPVVPEASDTPECPICLGAFDSMVAVLAACGHMYHKECIERWRCTPPQRWCQVCHDGSWDEARELFAPADRTIHPENRPPPFGNSRHRFSPDMSQTNTHENQYAKARCLVCRQDLPGSCEEGFTRIWHLGGSNESTPETPGQSRRNLWNRPR